MYKPKINTKELTPVLIAVAVGAGLYIVYKAAQKIGEGVDKGADIFGAGSEGKRAEKVIEDVNALKPEDNPFNPAYLNGRTKEYHILTGQQVTSMYKSINGLLSLWQTYKHPLSYEENRLKVIAIMKKLIRHRTQLAYLAKYYKSQGKDLFTVLNDGFRDTGITSGAKYQKMFTDLTRYLLKLPD